MLTLTEYYSNEENLKEMFNSISNPHWHYWVVQDSNGCFRHNPKKINSIRRLKEFIGNTPSKVYVSVGQFLQPQRVFGKHPKKAQWIIDDTLFLNSCLLFDFDGDGVDFKSPHEDGKKIIEFMETQKDYLLVDIWMSGKKGFNLLYKDINPIIEPHPIKRMQKTEERRKQLIDKLPELKTINLHHKRIIADQFRVHAVIGSIKAETGYKVRRLTEEEFMLSSTEELIRLTCQRVVRSTTEDFNPQRNGPMMGSHPANTTDGQPSVGHKGPTLTLCLLRLCESYTYHFIDNVVKGIKSTLIDEDIDYRYVTVLKYPINKNTVNIIKDTQEIYKLDSFYKFIYKDIQMYINFKLVDRRRLEKIMKYSKPMNLNSFMFYGHTWIPITKATDKNGNTIWDKPIFQEVIESSNGINDTHSRPHANLFGLRFDNMAGKETNNICKARVGE